MDIKEEMNNIEEVKRFLDKMEGDHHKTHTNGRVELFKQYFDEIKNSIKNKQNQISMNSNELI